MKDLENNKIVASILVAGLIALASGKIADTLYHPVEEPETRGYSIEVADTSEKGMKEEKVEEVIDIAALMASANSDAGQKTFKKCAACHTTEPGGPNRVGPNLAGIVGAQKALHADYSYSDALKAKGGTWNYEELFAFLKKPKAYAPGTKMTFAGLKKPQDIADVIAFLEGK